MLEYDQPQFLSYPLKSLISLALPRGHECQSRDIDIIFVVHDGFGTLCQIVPLLVSVDLLDKADYPSILYIYT